MNKEEEHLPHPSELWVDASYDVECLNQEISNFQYKYDYNRYTRLLRWAEIAMVSVSMTDIAQVKKAWKHVNNLEHFVNNIHYNEFLIFYEEAQEKGNEVSRSKLDIYADELQRQCKKILNVLQTAIDKAKIKENME